MAAFDFPSSPAVGDIYTLNGVAYQWNGYAWGGGPIVNSDAFVMKRGDTMTGDLTIAPPVGDGPEIFLNKPSVGSPARVWGQLNGVNRWRIALADGTAESGANAGSDFNITRYDDSGALLDAPFAIGRANGLITANIAQPTVFAHRSGGGDVAITASTWTKVNLGTIGSNINVGGWVINGSQGLTVPKTGLYLVGAQCMIQTPATANIALLAGFATTAAGPAARAGRGYHSVANNVSYNLNCQALIFCNAGDGLYLLAYAGAASCVVKDTNTDTYLWATMVAAQ